MRAVNQNGNSLITILENVVLSDDIPWLSLKFQEDAIPDDLLAGLLRFSIKNISLEVFHWLLSDKNPKKAAVIQAVNEPNHRGETALFIAASYCRYKAVDALLKNGATYLADQKGQTPLSVAVDTLITVLTKNRTLDPDLKERVQFCCWKVVQQFLTDPTLRTSVLTTLKRDPSLDQTATYILSKAVNERRSDIVQLLLQDNLAIQADDEKAETGLDSGCYSKACRDALYQMFLLDVSCWDVEIVRLLLEGSPDLSLYYPNDKASLVSVVLENKEAENKFELLALLLLYGAPVKEETVQLIQENSAEITQALFDLVMNDIEKFGVRAQQFIEAVGAHNNESKSVSALRRAFLLDTEDEAGLISVTPDFNKGRVKVLYSLYQHLIKQADEKPEAELYTARLFVEASDDEWVPEDCRGENSQQMKPL